MYNAFLVGFSIIFYSINALTSADNSQITRDLDPNLRDHNDHADYEPVSYYGEKHKHPGFTSGKNHIETLSWAVKFRVSSGSHARDFSSKASELAEQLGLTSQGPVGHFNDIYLLTLEHPIIINQRNSQEQLARVQGVQHDNFLKDMPKILDKTAATKHKLENPDQVDRLWSSIRDAAHVKLDEREDVDWYTQQVVRRRTKRSVLQINDPLFPKQWHLRNDFEPTMDINVTGVWERNITGRGVVAVVVDDGLEWTVPDIRPNYVKEGSWDLNSNDGDPLPDINDASNHHGTRCAGEIAAASNDFCGVGVAYEAGIAGIRVLDGPMTDSLEATAFTKNFDVNDVYSCSWGPDDDGKTVDGPHHLANLALRHGVDFGRRGYGTVYVVASGNGGMEGDNCNYDGYANSIFTMTIGAVDERGEMPYYAEECASMLAVTFSSGNPGLRYIVTTDWQHQKSTGCTEKHSGTSAAAPLAAGMVTLAMQARPCLTWRDLQHIVVVTALKVDIDIAHWQKNAAGLHHSHKHGFGLMDAWRIVNAAKVWDPVPWMTVFTSDLMNMDEPILGASAASYAYSAQNDRLDGYNLYTLEYVQVTVTIAHAHRGNLEVQLRCPSGTKSVLGATRPHDDSTEGFKAWTFSTVRCWGEKPEGNYTLTIKDLGKSRAEQGRFTNWQVKLYGSPMKFEEFQERIRRVEEAYSGAYLNDSYVAPCPPPPDKITLGSPISERVLKMLVLTGCFAFFLAVYESIEYVFCYEEEKKEYTKLAGLIRRAQTMIRNRARAAATGNSDSDGLLNSVDPEMIPMNDIAADSRRYGEGSTARLISASHGDSRGDYAQIPSNDSPSHTRQNLSTSQFDVHSSTSRRSELNSESAGVSSGAHLDLGEGSSELATGGNLLPPPMDFQSGDLDFDDFVSSNVAPNSMQR